MPLGPLQHWLQMPTFYKTFSWHYTAFIFPPEDERWDAYTALVSHGLGFCIPLSHIYDVKEKNMFAFYMVLTAAKMRMQWWNGDLGQHERVDS